MEATGNRCQLEAFEGQNHGFFNSPFFRPKTKDIRVYKQVMQKSRAFLISLGYLDDSASSKSK